MGKQYHYLTFLEVFFYLLLSILFHSPENANPIQFHFPYYLCSCSQFMHSSNIRNANSAVFVDETKSLIILFAAFFSLCHACYMGRASFRLGFLLLFLISLLNCL